jgi:hypothetical protein
MISVSVITTLFLSILAVNAAEPPRPIKLGILRMHSGADCTSGELRLEDTVVGYTLERPWNGNIPLISSIPAGRYKGFVRTRTADRWRIELVDVPHRKDIQMHVGNGIVDSVGCILVGSNLNAALCSLTNSKVAFDKFKIAFAEAAAKLGQKDKDTPIELVIGDK